MHNHNPYCIHDPFIINLGHLRLIIGWPRMACITITPTAYNLGHLRLTLVRGHVYSRGYGYDLGHLRLTLALTLALTLTLALSLALTPSPEP